MARSAIWVLVCLLVAPISSGAKKRKAPEVPRPPATTLVALNTHETYHLRPDANGRFSQKVLGGWNRFLRCHHTGRRHPMAALLAKLLYKVSEHFEYGKVLVVAGYRAPRVARKKGNTKSPHKRGVACDFRIEGVDNVAVRDYLRTLPGVGVGYYPNSNFVHLDVGRKVSAFWIDHSGPGERARYSKNAEFELAAESVEIPAESAQAPTGPMVLPAGGANPQTELAPGVPAPELPRLPESTN